MITIYFFFLIPNKESKETSSTDVKIKRWQYEALQWRNQPNNWWSKQTWYEAMENTLPINHTYLKNKSESKLSY